MLLESFVGEYACGANLDEITAEFVFQDSTLVATEIHVVMSAKDIEVVPTGILAIKADAAVAGDAAVHLMVHKRSKILIQESAFLEAKTPVSMSGHNSHVLKMAFTSFVAYGAIMGMVHHEPFDDGCAKRFGLRVDYRDSRALFGRRQARHDDLSVSILLVLELFNCALATRPD
jgi:hypothetical protein